MSAENLVFNSLRLNMNNKQHAKVNEVLSQVDRDVCKSKNQFIIDAIEYYVDHFGQESFVKGDDKTAEYITRNDMEQIKKELMEAAMTEARREVIRNLALVVSGRTYIDSNGPEVPMISHDEKDEDEEDDEVVSDLAVSWMKEMEEQ